MFVRLQARTLSAGHWLCLAAIVSCAALVVSARGEADPADAGTAAEQNRTTETSTTETHTTESLRGRVVWMAEALSRRFGVRTDPDAERTLVALESSDGELHPIVKDARGRAFHLDERLLDRELELVVRRYEGSPMVQVVAMRSVRPDGLFEIDYWCAICSIPMYELKQCECCQGPIELRERPVTERSEKAQ